jgi:hypothetical protein
MRFWIITAFGVVFILVIVALCRHPDGVSEHGLSLFGSEERIRASILQMTPLGTPIDRVKTCIQSRMHPDTFYFYEHADVTSLPGVMEGGKVVQGQWPLGGEHHGKEIGCQIGQGGLFEFVCACWVFDDEDRLADVFVYKNAASP